MTRAQALAWKARWETVNQAEIEELRRTPASVKLRQLATLMQWAREMGWEKELAAQEQEVRERWIRLREAHRA